MHASAGLITFIRSLATGISGVALLVGVWWLIAENTVTARFPAPPGVFLTILENVHDIPEMRYIYYSSSGLLENILYTFVNVVSSVAIGTVFGIVFGIFLARSSFIKLFIEPPLLVMATFPVVMLLPFFTMWFGTDRIAQYGLVLFYTFVTVTLVARQATQNVAGFYEDFALSLGASRRYFAAHAVVPAILPEIVGAVRISLAAGWGFETMAEILGAPLGAGRLIQVFSVAVMTEDIFGVLLCIGVIAVVTDALVALVGRWMVRWKD